MRLSFALVLLIPAFAPAQPTAAQKAETVKWVTAAQSPEGGFHPAPLDPRIDAMPKASLRATNGAMKALKYLGADVPNKEKHAAFVLSCYDPTTGGFAESGGKADVTITSIGIMTAAELGIPHAKFAKAMNYLKDNAKTFEEVRIGAAAVEAWGVKDCPFKLDEWFKIADKETGPDGTAGKGDGLPRETASVVAMKLRLGVPKRSLTNSNKLDDYLQAGQWEDGGYGQGGAKQSDIGSTYRVMRALMLLKEKPKDAKKLRAFIDAHRNVDGGYATAPGGTSSVSGTYYCTIISKWLDDMEAK